MTEKEKSHAGLLYQPNDPELAADRDLTVKKLYAYNNMHPLDREARQAAIRDRRGQRGHEGYPSEQPGGRQSVPGDPLPGVNASGECAVRLSFRPGRNSEISE